MIDTHVHLGGAFATADEWMAAARSHAIDGAVLVQHLGNSDNSLLLETRSADPSRWAVIAIPPTVEATQDVLDAGAVGVRLGPSGLHACPGDLDVFRILELHGAIASVTGPFDELAAVEFAAIVDAHPGVTFRLEHLAAFPFGDAYAQTAAFRPVLELAKRPHVVIMWSGFFHYSRARYPWKDAWPVLEESLEAFGAERITWSGDWNRAGGTDATYAADAALVLDLPFVDPVAADAILDASPRRLFALTSAGRP